MRSSGPNTGGRAITANQLTRLVYVDAIALLAAAFVACVKTGCRATDQAELFGVFQRDLARHRLRHCIDCKLTVAKPLAASAEDRNRLSY